MYTGEILEVKIEKQMEHQSDKFWSCFWQSMTITEAEEKLLTILKQVMEEKLTASNVEVRNEDSYSGTPKYGH